MDGNGRWAEQRGERRTYGHQQAVQAVEDVVVGCIELGVSFLTLYAFSIENRQRPEKEVSMLMELMTRTLTEGVPRFLEHGVRLRYIGDLGLLPAVVANSIDESLAATAKEKRLQLCVALNYSGRWELKTACQSIAKALLAGELQVDQITEDVLRSHLQTQQIPDPELLIRTGGEQRISNFLLWQVAYTELYFTEVMWPDFRKEHLQAAVQAYQHRERRFGKISAQLRAS